MNDDDKVLSTVLKEEADENPVRADFTDDVLRRLPGRKRNSSARRMTLLLSFAGAGCLAVWFAAGSDLTRMAAAIAGHDIHPDASGKIAADPACLPLIACVAALAVAACFLARRENFR